MKRTLEKYGFRKCCNQWIRSDDAVVFYSQAFDTWEYEDDDECGSYPSVSELLDSGIAGFVYELEIGYENGEIDEFYSRVSGSYWLSKEHKDVEEIEEEMMTLDYDLFYDLYHNPKVISITVKEV